MKKILPLLLVLASFQLLIGQDCTPTNITLKSQAEVNTFATSLNSCNTVTGNLTIQGNDITDLSGLQNLTSIGGALGISETGITDLGGLQNLNSIGFLLITGNAQLTNVDGLQGLTSIQGGLLIGSNPQLTNLDGLQNLNSASGIFQIVFNDQLNEFCGLYTLLNGGASPVLILSSNASNPPRAEILDGGPCERILPEPEPAQELPVMPLPYLLTFALGIFVILTFAARRVL